MSLSPAPDVPDRLQTFLAFDFGLKRTGVAVGTRMLRSATPQPTIHAEGDARFAQVKLRIDEWRPDALVVGAVGRLTYQKAPEDFVAALAILARIQPALPGLVGVWIGGGELAGRVARLAARTPEVPLVFAGERTDVMKLLPALNVFALPSRYEGLPTAVVEAMVAGVPVVATDVNAVTDVVRPGHSGLLVPPQRPDLLAVAVRRLLDEPDLAARLAANASALVSDRYHTIELRNALDSAYTSNPPTRVRPGGQPGNRAEGPAHLGL